MNVVFIGMYNRVLNFPLTRAVIFSCLVNSKLIKPQAYVMNLSHIWDIYLFIREAFVGFEQLLMLTMMVLIRLGTT